MSDESVYRDDNTLGGRARRYARVGTGLGGLALRFAGGKALGFDSDTAAQAAELKAALGSLKGPLMKVAQMLATIPEALPAEYAAELAQLQANAPPMGWAFVKRRMASELGRDWQSHFSDFEREAAAAASLGQVHRATDHGGRKLACKLQYPDMASAIEADLNQLSALFALYRRLNPVIDPAEMQNEISVRLREELDYELEAAHIALYREMLAEVPGVTVPDVVPELSTQRLLTMSWLEGKPLPDFVSAPLAFRNTIATNLFTAWWQPFAHYAAIHGDPHLGNYTVREDGGINLLDYGCVRTFRPQFVAGVIELYRALLAEDRDRAAAAYESWGFESLSNELIDVLNLWAQFIYGPLMDDRVRTIADGVSAGEYGRREAFEVHGALKAAGRVKPPREFVFMDRAAIGLGGVLLGLGAELNYYALFNAAIEDFEGAAVASRQQAAFGKAGVPLPE